MVDGRNCFESLLAEKKGLGLSFVIFGVQTEVDVDQEAWIKDWGTTTSFFSPLFGG